LVEARAQAAPGTKRGRPNRWFHTPGSLSPDDFDPLERSLSTAGFDVVVVGAGAAGLFCAGLAGHRGLRVLLLDHALKLAEKIRISGGGRCNFTNLNTGPNNFLSENPRFCRSALARYTPADFIALVRRHGIGFHEKHRGQLFCDQGSQSIIDMLVDECRASGVQRWQPCTVHGVQAAERHFEVTTSRGPVRSSALVVASGGLSIPKLGASDFGYRIARQFGHRVIEPRPALVPLTFDSVHWAPFAQLAGVALPVHIAAGDSPARCSFDEDLLFTHRGLSGPAVLQASSYWRPGQAIEIDLGRGQNLGGELKQAKTVSRRRLGNELARWLPARLADTWVRHAGMDADRSMAEVPDRELVRLAQSLSRWRIVPSGCEGWSKAEVTAGGVDTRELDSKTLQSRRQPGLYFIGEVVDVTGWLGGYNFQWAWASAAACANALAAS
jgi:predicted Rossmann fold flavoprotein